jgi:hypothetical protein
MNLNLRLQSYQYSICSSPASASFCFLSADWLTLLFHSTTLQAWLPRLPRLYFLHSNTSQAETRFFQCSLQTPLDRNSLVSLLHMCILGPTGCDWGPRSTLATWSPTVCGHVAQVGGQEPEKKWGLIANPMGSHYNSHSTIWWSSSLCFGHSPEISFPDLCHAYSLALNPLLI